MSDRSSVENKCNNILQPHLSTDAAIISNNLSPAASCQQKTSVSPFPLLPDWKVLAVLRQNMPLGMIYYNQRVLWCTKIALSFLHFNTKFKCNNTISCHRPAVFRLTPWSPFPSSAIFSSSFNAERLCIWPWCISWSLNLAIVHFAAGKAL